MLYLFYDIQTEIKKKNIVSTSQNPLLIYKSLRKQLVKQQWEQRLDMFRYVYKRVIPYPQKSAEKLMFFHSCKTPRWQPIKSA